MKINTRGPSTPEICEIKIIGLGLVKSEEERGGLARWIKNCGRTAANLKLRGWSHLDKSQTWEET